jgi:hypothetical protein
VVFAQVPSLPGGEAGSARSPEGTRHKRDVGAGMRIASGVLERGRTRQKTRWSSARRQQADHIAAAYFPFHTAGSTRGADGIAFLASLNAPDTRTLTEAQRARVTAVQSSHTTTHRISPTDPREASSDNALRSRRPSLRLRVVFEHSFDVVPQPLGFLDRLRARQCGAWFGVYVA